MLFLYLNSCAQNNIYYFQKKQYDQAIADYSKAIELLPTKRAEFFSNRGKCFINKKQYDQAICDYTQAIEMNPGKAGFYQERAAVFQAIGKFEKASADQEKAESLELKSK